MDCQALETSIRIETPEQTAFELRLAGPMRRFPAYLIDLVLRCFLLLGFSFLMEIVVGSFVTAEMTVGPLLLFWFFLSWVYGGMFEAYWNGQTPGKRLMGLRVVTVEGSPISGTQAILRNILREVDAQPGVLYLVGLLVASSNKRFQRLGDLACGTMVIFEERRFLRMSSPSIPVHAIALAGRLPVNLNVPSSLHRTLALYMSRRQTYSFSRRCEIAEHLARLLRQQASFEENIDPDTLVCALYYSLNRDETELAPTPGTPIAEWLPAIGGAQ